MKLGTKLVTMDGKLCGRFQASRSLSLRANEAVEKVGKGYGQFRFSGVL